MCGVPSQMKTVFNEQNSLFNTLSNQAQQIFGATSTAFKNLISAFSPIVAAGPNQEGMTPAQLADQNAKIMTGVGTAYTHAKEAAGAAIGAQGGGNVVLPGGAAVAQQVGLASAAAQETAGEQEQMREKSREMGQERFFAAAKGMEEAPSMFGASTQAGEAASGAGGQASKTAGDIAQADNSWVQGVTGALGGIAGNVVSGGFKMLSTGSGKGGTQST